MQVESAAWSAAVSALAVGPQRLTMPHLRTGSDPRPRPAGSRASVNRRMHFASGGPQNRARKVGKRGGFDGWRATGRRESSFAPSRCPAREGKLPKVGSTVVPLAAPAPAAGVSRGSVFGHER